MEDNLEYYIIGRANNEKYPLLVAQAGSDNEEEDEYIEDLTPMTYRLGNPISKNPVIVDYHSSPSSVISRKIADVLEKMKIKDIQLIPATITGKNDELYEDYFYLHIYNLLPALDKAKSVYTWSDFLEIANPIEKLVLNNKALSEISLEDRLIFRLQENSTFEIFHKSVVDAITEVNPEGVQFVKVEI